MEGGIRQVPTPLVRGLESKRPGGNAEPTICLVLCHTDQDCVFVLSISMVVSVCGFFFVFYCEIVV